MFEIVLVAIIADPTAPVYLFQPRRPSTRMPRGLPLLQQLQCRDSGFVQSQTARKLACTPGFLAKLITCSGQIIAIDQSLPNSSRTTRCEFGFAAFRLWVGCRGTGVEHDRDASSYVYDLPWLLGP